MPPPGSTLAMCHGWLCSLSTRYGAMLSLPSESTFGSTCPFHATGTMRSPSRNCSSIEIAERRCRVRRVARASSSCTYCSIGRPSTASTIAPRTRHALDRVIAAAVPGSHSAGDGATARDAFGVRDVARRTCRRRTSGTRRCASARGGWCPLLAGAPAADVLGDGIVELSRPLLPELEHGHGGQRLPGEYQSMTSSVGAAARGGSRRRRRRASARRRATRSTGRSRASRRRCRPRAGPRRGEIRASHGPER